MITIKSSISTGLRTVAGWFDSTQDSSNRRPDLPGVSHQAESIEKVLKRYDHSCATAVARKLYSVSGVIKGMVDSLAMYSVGTDYNVQFYGKNQDWNRNTTDYLNEMFVPICDITGKRDLCGSAYLTSVALDRDGDQFLHLTKNAKGWPFFQFFSSYQVGMRSFRDTAVIQSGPYKGYNQCKGVAYNNFGRPVGYHILGDKPDNDKWVSANDVIHFMDPSFNEQMRGFPSFAHGLNTIRTQMTATEWEEFATMAASAIALIEWNDTGDDRGMRSKFTATDDTVDKKEEEKEKTLFGGMMKLYRANSGQKIETMQHNRPGQAWESFQDRLVRMVTAGSVWPYEIIWEAKGTGPAIRLKIGQASRHVRDRQGVLDRGYRRAMQYATARLIKEGKIPFDPDWYKLGFTHPYDLGIDAGRESAADVKDVDAGLQSRREIIRKRGSNEERVLRDEFERELVIKEFEQEYGIPYPGRKDDTNENA